MPRWTPSQEWKGQDAYVIGGGSSLSTFDWELLRGKNTIGCNSAYSLGAHICKIVVFADQIWWETIGKKNMVEYGGRVVGCSPRLVNDDTPWLLKMDRNNHAGLGKTRLGFPGNTGGLAINLALIMGAQRVFLLGFDMKLGEGMQKFCRKPGVTREEISPGRANWHDIRMERSNAQSYTRFVREFQHFARTLPEVFPGREIINVTDDSKLDCFPKVSLAEHFQKVGAT